MAGAGRAGGGSESRRSGAVHRSTASGENAGQAVRHTCSQSSEPPPILATSASRASSPAENLPEGGK